MPLIPTLGLLVLAIAVMLVSGWRGSRPPDLVKGPRMMPWRMIMLLSAALITFLIIHLATLAGMTRL